MADLGAGALGRDMLHCCCFHVGYRVVEMQRHLHFYVDAQSVEMWADRQIRPVGRVWDAGSA